MTKRFGVTRQTPLSDEILFKTAHTAVPGLVWRKLEEKFSSRQIALHTFDEAEKRCKAFADIYDGNKIGIHEFTEEELEYITYSRLCGG